MTKFDLDGEIAEGGIGTIVTVGTQTLPILGMRLAGFKDLVVRRNGVGLNKVILVVKHYPLLLGGGKILTAVGGAPSSPPATTSAQAVTTG